MIYLEDPDFTLHQGDVLDVLREMPDESVDCVITSPPYWGLRDYGTGEWEGGDPEHVHETVPARAGRGGSGSPGKQTEGAFPSEYAASRCSCGATRSDNQIGLEPTPEEYVARLVEVFREVRRVLAKHGTCWCNMGDSYNAGRSGGWAGGKGSLNEGRDLDAIYQNRSGPNAPGLKPKDLVGVPWRLAFALQADGWYLRSDIVWFKANPMPESVTDRPTKAHEYVFLLSKSPRYWFDAEAVREPAEWARWGDQTVPKYEGTATATGWMENGKKEDLQARSATGRNIRSVWEIASQPYPEAHFATYPEELVRRCLLAGCPEQVCRTCGKARERELEFLEESTYAKLKRENDLHWTDMNAMRNERGVTRQSDKMGGNTAGPTGTVPSLKGKDRRTTGWSDCGHGDYRPGVVLDPFLGSGTTALVARKHGRRCIGIELNPDYCALAARRLSQLSLLAEAP